MIQVHKTIKCDFCGRMAAGHYLETTHNRTIRETMSAIGWKSLQRHKNEPIGIYETLDFCDDCEKIANYSEDEDSDSE